MKEVLSKEMWYVAPVSKIKRCEFLPLGLNECKFMTKGEVEKELALGLGLDCWSNYMMLLYCSWVNPNDDATEPCWEESKVMLTKMVDWGLLPTLWDLLFPLNPDGKPCLIK